MPTECPPKQPEPAPNPSGPDPEAVRRALAEIDHWNAKLAKGEITAPFHFSAIHWVLSDYRAEAIDAMRAWLAQQGEASE